MMVRRAKIVNYLGLVVDENLYWNVDVDFVYDCLVCFWHIWIYQIVYLFLIARQVYFISIPASNMALEYVAIVLLIT